MPNSFASSKSSGASDLGRKARRSGTQLRGLPAAIRAARARALRQGCRGLAGRRVPGVSSLGAGPTSARRRAPSAPARTSATRGLARRRQNMV